MTQISGLRFQVDNAANAVLNRAHAKMAPSQAPVASFSDRIGDGLKSVADSQNEAKTLAQNYELGLEQDLSKVMVSQQVSSLGFQLTLSMRNKALSAYKDIMNMPV
ncbi:MAG: flagellar hook-basal body complex protein FliE [Paracoccaceae bacterium]|jgi:flagellar hook-basal body complex protein FliE